MKEMEHGTRLSRDPTITEFRALDKDKKFMEAMKKLDPNFTRMEDLIDLDRSDVRVLESREKESQRMKIRLDIRAKARERNLAARAPDNMKKYIFLNKLTVAMNLK